LNLRLKYFASRKKTSGKSYQYDTSGAGSKTACLFGVVTVALNALGIHVRHWREHASALSR